MAAVAGSIQVAAVGAGHAAAQSAPSLFDPVAKAPLWPGSVVTTTAVAASPSPPQPCCRSFQQECGQSIIHDLAAAEREALHPGSTP